MKVFISWAMNQHGLPQLGVQRLIVNSKLPEAKRIKAEGERFGLPVIMDDVETVPERGDLWVGLCPKHGWGDVAGETGEARTIEASIVLARLRNAKPAVKRWAIEFRNGGFFQGLGNDTGGPDEKAQTFDTQKDAEAFMVQHELNSSGGMAKEIEVPPTN